ncbi:MAG TPA: amidohydrolase [Firmicutes bacterium]|nr:amidohydrolase [Candidatus Fermentithermobacillaceae bacterium]
MAERVALINGKIFTAQDGQEEVQALLYEDGKILKVGSTTQLLEMIGGRDSESALVVDLGGRTAIPGFIDSHNHVLSLATLLEGVNCFGLKTIDELKEAVAAKAREAAPGEWIIGAGWIESQFAERRLPNRWDLDEAAPENPVCLSRLFGMVVVNSKALELAGIGHGFVPEMGRVDLDASGEPTGILREGASGYVRRAMTSVRAATSARPPGAGRSVVDTEDTERRIVLALKELLKYGVTSVLDPGVAGETMRAYTSLWAKNALPARVSAMPGWHGMSSVSDPEYVPPAVEAGLQPGMGDEWFRIGNLKMAIDGGLGSKTAMMHAPWRDGTRTTIPARLDLNRLGTYISEAHAAGWGVGIHCCGDLAQDIALSHMVDVLSRKKALPHQRHHIVHGYYPTGYALDVMAEYDIAVSLQPGFIYVEGDIYPDNIDEGLLAGFKPARTYLSRGIRVAINTDVASGPYDPFVTLYGAVARKTMTGLDFGRAEALTVREALRCFTLGGAYLAYRDRECGLLAPGYLADIAVLDRDILDAGPEELLKVKVVATILGGKFVHITEVGPRVPAELIK